MLTLIILAMCVPILASVTYLGLRKWQPQFAADVRGIALQTVIVIVVLLGIAGAVAGVLISRGGEVIADLEAQDIRTERSEATTETECDILGGVWTQANTIKCV